MPLNFIAQMKASAKAKAEADFPLVLHIPGPLSADQFNKIKEAVKQAPPPKLEPVFSHLPSDTVSIAKSKWSDAERIKVALELFAQCGIIPDDAEITQSQDQIDHMMHSDPWSKYGGGPPPIIGNVDTSLEINFTVTAKNVPQLAGIIESEVKGKHWPGKKKLVGGGWG